MRKINNPSISVVLTSFNHKEFLSQSLDSIIHQSFNDYEFIIWDDNSTDGSREVLQNYKEKYPDIHLHLNDVNSGRYTISTNRGAAKAVGDYIIFEQCDDFADRDQLETLIDAARKHPEAGLIFSSSRMVDVNNTLIRSDFDARSCDFQKYCASDCFIPKEKLEQFLLESCVLPNLSAVLIRRDIFENLKGLDENYVVIADWDFYLRASSLCGAYYIRRELNNFRQHGTTIRNSVKMETQIDELMKMFIGHFSSMQSPGHDRRRAFATVSDVWWSFMKKSPGIWFSSFGRVFKGFRKYGATMPYVILWYLFLHPYRALLFKLSHYY